MDDPDTYPRMPIRAKPYQHQREAFAFACRMFGLIKGGDDDAGTAQPPQADDRPAMDLET